jgi:hypothetical protein
MLAKHPMSLVQFSLAYIFFFTKKKKKKKDANMGFLRYLLKM